VCVRQRVVHPAPRQERSLYQPLARTDDSRYVRPLHPGPTALGADRFLRLPAAQPNCSASIVRRRPAYENLQALAFEFVNGFHDTANAVATVTYTRALPANFAVVWSGLFNLLGVLASSGAVAFGITRSTFCWRTDRVCHRSPAPTKRLIPMDGAILRGLVFDFCIKFGAQ
jgi:hypothetical protein